MTMNNEELAKRLQELEITNVQAFAAAVEMLIAASFATHNPETVTEFIDDLRYSWRFIEEHAKTRFDVYYYQKHRKLKP